MEGPEELAALYPANTQFTPPLHTVNFLVPTETGLHDQSLATHAAKLGSLPPQGQAMPSAPLPLAVYLSHSPLEPGAS